MKHNSFNLYKDIQDIRLAHSLAAHALREYRQWRDNSYIGQHLGSARTDYLALLRRRVQDAIDAYQSVRNMAQPLYREAC